MIISTISEILMECLIKTFSSDKHRPVSSGLLPDGDRQPVEDLGLSGDRHTTSDDHLVQGRRGSCARRTHSSEAGGKETGDCVGRGRGHRVLRVPRRKRCWAGPDHLRPTGLWYVHVDVLPYRSTCLCPCQNCDFVYLNYVCYD